MRKITNKRGFTMAELLTVVAIISILCSVAFVNIVQHQRNLKFMESNHTAKELFIAAQNHLSAVESLGQLAQYNTDVQLGAVDEDGARVIVSKRSELGQSEDQIINDMLPFGAIDDTARIGGSYIIRYDYENMNILDVYYAGDYDFKVSDLKKLKAATSDERKYYKKINNEAGSKVVVGWYGGEGLGSKHDNYLQEPNIQVINGDRLEVRVSNMTHQRAEQYENPDKPGTSVIVTGCTSGATREFKIAESKETGYFPYMGTEPAVVVLDDITAPDSHFVKKTEKAFPPIAGQLDFIPGEDIEVRAVSYDNTKLSNIAQSGKVVVNSLFNYVRKNDDPLKPSTIEVANLRHLENLEPYVSGVSWNQMRTSGIIDSDTELNVEQVSDMDWLNFPSDEEVGTATTIYNNLGVEYNEDEFLPITPSLVIHYNGNNHCIKSIKTSSSTSDCGMFTAITGDVSNLALVDVKADATGNVGALAGTLNGDIYNVVAYKELTAGSTTYDCVSRAGTAGGLVGVLHGNADYAAAANLVSGKECAGGLFGWTDGAVANSYSGGTTKDGKYDPDHINVSSDAVAGGLTGKCESATFDSCYSTCSASGQTAGGFVGNADKGSIKGCYVTGLVSGETKGIFAGSVTETELASNTYYRTANKYMDDPETSDDDESQVALIGNTESENITPFDENTSTYMAFVGQTRHKASPYDNAIAQVYNSEYPLRGIEEPVETPGAEDVDDNPGNDVPANTDLQQNLDEPNETSRFIYASVHYGDWPIPELVFENQKQPNN